MRIKIKGGIIPPRLFTALDGKTYIVPQWKEVPGDTKLEDISWEPTKYEQPKPVATFESSSHKGIFYEVLKAGNNYSCTCPGHKYRKKICKHIKEIVENE